MIGGCWVEGAEGGRAGWRFAAGLERRLQPQLTEKRRRSSSAGGSLSSAVRPAEKEAASQPGGRWGLRAMGAQLLP